MSDLQDQDQDQDPKLVATECFEGWSAESGNRSGQCCCNCKWQRPISGHPWNKTPAFHGRISIMIAWGCTVPDMSNITLSEREHSMCEMHEKREADA